MNELEKANIENQRQIESLLEKTKHFFEKKEGLNKHINSNGDEINGLFVKIPNNTVKSKQSLITALPAQNEKSHNFIDRNKKVKTNEDISGNESKFNIEESPADLSTIRKIGIMDDKHFTKENQTSNMNNSLINNSPYNINTINQRLLEKIKIIKNLEKELKEKTSVIQKLNSKLDKQNLEIIKLNEKLNIEKQTPFIRNENIELLKKLKFKEEEIFEKNRQYEDVVGEYKNKLQSVMNINNSSLEKIKELESVNKSLHQTNQTIENNFKIFKTNLDKELKEKKGQIENNSQLLQNVKQLFKLISNYKNNLTNFSENGNVIFEKLNSLFTNEKVENPLVDNKNYLIESNMTNSINYYQDEDYLIK